MTGFNVHIFLFLIPAIIGNIAHMLVVKKNYFSFLSKPISSKYFGVNKTYRGFVFLPLAMGIICLIESLIFGPIYKSYAWELLLGIGLGFVYMLSELPNSFIKRQIGISTGTSSKNYRLTQLIIDKLDSIIGMLIFYYLMVQITIEDIALLFIIALVIHFSLSYLLVIIKLKKSI